MAAAEAPADTQFEQRELLLERSALIAEHDAGAEVRDADTGLLCRRRGLLPLHAQVGEEPCPGRARLVDLGVAGVAVVANG